MRDTRRAGRRSGTAFAAALASLLGLGPQSAAALALGPEAYQAAPESGAPLPAWLVRHKLRQLGYRDIIHVEALRPGFAVQAQDRWGRRVKLYVDAATGEPVPQGGYGLAHLKREEVEDRLGRLGYQCLGPIASRDGHYQVLARGAAGERCLLNVDALSGAVWHERV